MNLDDHLKARLDQRHAEHRYRVRSVVESAQGVNVRIGDQPGSLSGSNPQSHLNFCSNDYLGLANHPYVVDAFTQAAKEYGVGSGASHLVCGHTRIHHQLEEALAEFTGRSRALLFSTGYMANLGVVNALVSRKDAVFQDKLNHASLIDAGQLSGADFVRFRHNDMAHLESRLQSSTAKHKLVVVDGVFSMDGDVAPLPAIATLAAQNNAWLMVDDAHGFGCLGETGAGIAEHFQLNQKQLPILMATLGKAFGSFGAFVAGSDALIESLIQFARPYIYTTAMPAAVAAATLASLHIVRSEPQRREHLHSLIQYFCEGAKAFNVPLMSSATAIQPVFIGGDANALKLTQWLREKNIWVSAIRPPTVPEGTARLRITLCAAHTKQDVDVLLNALRDGIKHLNIKPVSAP